MRRRLLAVALLAAWPVVAVGCGSGGSSSAVSGEPIGLEQLARSASTSAEAASGRFAFDMTFSSPMSEEPFSLSGEGAFDKASERTSFTVDMSSFAQLLGGFFKAFASPDAKDVPDFDDPDGWQLETVQDGEVSYVRFPALAEELPEGKTWIRSDGKSIEAGGFEYGELASAASSDPRQALELLEAAGGEIEVIGTEDLRGIETTHYRATLDPVESAKTLTPDEREELGPLTEQLETLQAEVPVDVWLDADGLIRKVSFAISAGEQGQEGSASVTFELWDYGEDVEIELPPADEVVDASALRS